MKKFTTFIYKVLFSRKFFFVILGLFIIEAAWFALTAQYPMAFDENYHFGIIKIYSHQWLPFISVDPPDSGSFGDLTRYDSYLYHYLMSFPYRLITLFTSNETVQIIILRFINIALFATGIVFFRKLIKRLHVNEAISNISFLMLILIPVVPFLAATINYDNLVFLAVPITVGFALTCVTSFKNNRIPARALMGLFIAGGLASLVKYAFAPIFAATIIYLLVVFLRNNNKKVLANSLLATFTRTKLLTKIVLIIGVVITAGLLGERYGINIVEYHSIEPDCARIQSVDICQSYGPWARNYAYEQLAESGADPDFATGFYPFVWLGGMMMRLFFAINYNYANSYPLPIPIYTAAGIGALGIVLLILYRKYILSIDKEFLLLGVVFAAYVATLFYTNISDFLKLGSAVAINGRYLIIVLPLILPMLALAYRAWFEHITRKRTQLLIASFSFVILLLMLQGGGMLTHLVQSQDWWYWNNGFVRSADSTLRSIVSPLIVGATNK